MRRPAKDACEELIRALLIERYGVPGPHRRALYDATPLTIAARRRVLLGLDEPAKAPKAAAA